MPISNPLPSFVPRSAHKPLWYLEALQPRRSLQALPTAIEHRGAQERYISILSMLANWMTRKR